MPMYQDIVEYFIKELALGRNLDEDFKNRIEHFKVLITHLRQNPPIKLGLHLEQGVQNFSASFFGWSQRYANLLQKIKDRYDAADSNIYNSNNCYSDILNEDRAELDQFKDFVKDILTNSEPPAGAQKYDMKISWYRLHMALTEVQFQDAIDITSLKTLLINFVDAIKLFPLKTAENSTSNFVCGPESPILKDLVESVVLKIRMKQFISAKQELNKLCEEVLNDIHESNYAHGYSKPYNPCVIENYVTHFRTLINQQTMLNTENKLEQLEELKDSASEISEDDILSNPYSDNSNSSSANSNSPSANSNSPSVNSNFPSDINANLPNDNSSPDTKSAAAFNASRKNNLKSMASIVADANNNSNNNDGNKNKNRHKNRNKPKIGAV